MRRDTGDTYQEFLTQLAQASGIASPTRDARLLQLIAPCFELVDFHVVSRERVRFQAITLRVPQHGGHTLSCGE